MGQDAQKKSVLILCDDDLLSRVIELALDRHVFQTWSVLLGSPDCQAPQLDLDGTDLIVLALSSASNEPVVALTKASLTHIIGQIPLLIISSKRFQPDTNVPIYHLDFPFDVRELQAQVRKALGGVKSCRGELEQPAGVI